jgi:hypothetical protein
MNCSLFLSVLALCYLAGISEAKETCLMVKQGSFYTSVIPFYGFNTNAVITNNITLKASTASYIFKPDDPMGRLCVNSWNKLFGSTRCGFLNDIHKDSDRFVWRRAQSCVVFDGSFSVGEVDNCAEKNLIEIAAYSYDNYDKPFENQGRLLKEFKTKVRVEQKYGYRITNTATNSVFDLFDSDGSLIESKVIDHRDCGSSFKQGTIGKLYFGGQCPAPSQVDVCYEE